MTTETEQDTGVEGLLPRFVDLVEELCDAVDDAGDDIGGHRGSLTILREIGPLVDDAREAIDALSRPSPAGDDVKERMAEAICRTIAHDYGAKDGELNEAMMPNCRRYARAALAAAPGRVVPEGWRHRLREIHSALDDALGDTDISHVESDEELREYDPIQWAAQKLAFLISTPAAVGWRENIGAEQAVALTTYPTDLVAAQVVELAVPLFRAFARGCQRDLGYGDIWLDRAVQVFEQEFRAALAAYRAQPRPYREWHDDYEQTWEQMWRGLVAPDGELDLEQVKKELHDYAMMMEQVSIVYCHVTGGLLSKTNYLAVSVTTAADDHITKLVEEEVSDRVAGAEDMRRAAENVVIEADLTGTPDTIRRRLRQAIHALPAEEK